MRTHLLKHFCTWQCCQFHVRSFSNINLHSPEENVPFPTSQKEDDTFERRSHLSITMINSRLQLWMQVPHPTLNMILSVYCICPTTLIIFYLPMLCSTSLSIFSLITEWIAPVLSLLPWVVILAFTVADSIWRATCITFCKVSSHPNGNCLNMHAIVLRELFTVLSDLFPCWHALEVELYLLMEFTL